MAAITHYKPLSSDEGKPPEKNGDWFSSEWFTGEWFTSEWFEYPGEKRSNRELSTQSSSSAPPNGSIFVKTGGNALQAINGAVCDQKDLMKVVVPDLIHPIDTMLVMCPDGSGRMVSVKIPPESYPGHVILVRIPPVEPVLVTGVPVTGDVKGANKRVEVVDGYDIGSASAENDLTLQQENNHTSMQEDKKSFSRHKKQSKDDVEHEFEMV